MRLDLYQPVPAYTILSFLYTRLFTRCQRLLDIPTLHVKFYKKSKDKTFTNIRKAGESYAVKTSSSFSSLARCAEENKLFEWAFGLSPVAGERNRKRSEIVFTHGGLELGFMRWRDDT